MSEPSADGEQPRELRRVPSEDDKYVKIDRFLLSHNPFQLQVHVHVVREK